MRKGSKNDGRGTFKPLPGKTWGKTIGSDHGKRFRGIVARTVQSVGERKKLKREKNERRQEKSFI